MSSLAQPLEPPHFPLELKRIAVLLALSIFINYVDRGSLSIAAPLLKDDLRLSPSQLGILLSSFFWTYAFCQILSGWAVDRFNVNWLLAIGVAVWSAATLSTGLVRNFELLLAARLMLGIGESASYPGVNKIIVTHFQESQRGRANGMVSAGWAGGPAIGTLVGGLLVAHVGWRMFFVVLGLASALWLLPWLAWMPKGPGVGAVNGQTTASTPAGMLEILAQRSAWGTFIGLFAFNYIWYFLITWLPFYLVKHRNFSLQAMSYALGIAFFALGVSVVGAGWYADHAIAAGKSPTIVLKALCGGGVAISGLCFVLMFLVANPTLAMGMLVLSCVALGLGSPNLWTMTQILAGPGTSGRWTGLENFCGNLAGISGPIVAGFVVEKTGSFFWAFAITAVIAWIGAAAYVFVVGPVVPVTWRSHSSSTP